MYSIFYFETFYHHGAHMHSQLPPHWFRNFGAIAFEHLSENLHNIAIFVVNHNQEIIFWSKGAEELLGFTPEDALQQHCLKTNRCQQCIQSCGLQKHNQIDGVQIELHRKDGSKILVKKYAQSFRGDNGEFLGGIEILHPLEKHDFTTLIQDDFHGLLTRTDSMRKLFQQIRSVAKTDIPVLARGESGTGKELLAQAIHQESDRKNEAFIAVNCSAIPEGLIESELFGHIKGSFTGAHKDRKGLFEQAHKGSLFLDEIAELPLPIQAKLLRVLESKTIKKLGSNDEIPVDVRIIAATHTSIRQAVQDGKFREDLMYRLRVVPLFIPPVKERPDDIELLLWHFVQRNNALYHRQVHTIHPNTLEKLKTYGWPGNVREIRNIIDYAFALGVQSIITDQHIPPEILFQPKPNIAIPEIPTQPTQTPSSHLQLLTSEADRIQLALEQSKFNLGDTANLLGMSRATLWRKRKQYGI